MRIAVCWDCRTPTCFALMDRLSTLPMMLRGKVKAKMAASKDAAIPKRASETRRLIKLVSRRSLASTRWIVSTGFLDTS